MFFFNGVESVGVFCVSRFLFAKHSTYMLGRLQIDNDNFSSFAFGLKWKISAWFNLHGCAKSECQISSSAKCT